MLEPINWRARIGLITTSGQLITESRFPYLAPKGVTFHVTRMMNESGGMAGLIKMEKQSWRGVEELSTARVTSLGYCCTVSGALRGLKGDMDFCRQVEQQYGIPTTSTMLAAVEALKTLDMKRIVVTSPYQDDHHESERKYLAEAGIDAFKMKGMGKSSSKAFSTTQPQEIYDFSLAHWDPSADGLFVSCMNFDAIAVAQDLEEAIGKPVITSHTVTLWRTLSLSGIDDPIEGLGQLLTMPRVGMVAAAV